MAAAKRRNGLVLVATLVGAAVLTGKAYDEPPGSSRLPLLAYLLAAVLVLGGLLSGRAPKHHKRGKHPVAGPVLTALVLFVVFLVVGAVARLVPGIDHAVTDVLARADRGSALALWVSAIVAGGAEEFFYRGALFERVSMPIVTTTAAHMLATLPAGNIALTGAAAVLGGACGMLRRTSGGWWAPAVTHTAWTLLMVALLPR